MGKDCIIGLWIDYEYAELVTLGDLKANLANEMELNESRKEYGQLLKQYEWTLNDICDGRKNTNVRRFKFCPNCGKEIDWKSFKVKQND